MIGHQTVGERAGLTGGVILSYIRVTYPDAGRGLFIHTSISVYLFFGKEGRLIKLSVEQFNEGL